MMRRPLRRLASVAAALLIGLTIAGCGDDNGDDPPEESESGGPLAEFFGWDENARGDDVEFTEEERQQHYQVQEIVVACMTEAGFEYTPEEFYGDRDEIVDDPHAEIWQLQEDDPERFAREYGYGFTTIEYEDRGELIPDASTDPNMAYRESLSPAAQEEYDQTLWGEVPEFVEGETAEPAPVEPSGCQNEAYEEVYGGGEREGEQQFEALLEEWDTLYQRVEDDPRMDEARRTWSGCMADAGYPDLENLYAGQEQVSQRQSEVYGWEDGGGAVPLPVPEEGGGTSEAEATPSAPPEPDPAALEELRQYERDIATADYTCRQEHSVDDTERDVRFEHEGQFIEDHRTDLEAYRDWMNEQGIRG